MVVTGLHVTGSGRWALLAGGGLIVALAAFSGPPLGAWSLLGRRSHRVADWAAVVLLAASPALPGRDGVSILVLEACAFVLWRVAAVTRYGPRPAPVAAAVPAPAPGAGPAAPPTRPRTPAAARPPAPSPALAPTLRRGARKAGIAVGIIQRRRRSGPSA